ncbi:protein RETICULATA-RELATED 3, chloroplastic-like [Amaranthus tricolor]|uniref:protein RETICULATA-RELATED 3, chloroplastic-like n=1 Tax=Amaranthus tricolor TaxID=29722 RepID=UPI00258A4ECC|nr:protein RETICULATA-RELATED 3, chloroplastic-like [Amaranthus tricolor]XP_057515486.1 protein RETICULATA-RELATED 3, chloroplastic-like [Amaranthus tricolor]
MLFLKRNKTIKKNYLIFIKTSTYTLFASNYLPPHLKPNFAANFPPLTTLFKPSSMASSMAIHIRYPHANQLRFHPLSPNRFTISNSVSFPSIQNLDLKLNSTFNHNLKLCFSSNGGGGAGYIGGNSGGGGGSDGEDSSSNSDKNDGNSSLWENLGLIGIFIKGWKSRVSADPQFPFKVLMEELVGVTSCVIGDMASRPNFGLNELDFVFSTLVVGSILNFVLMYLLAPTASMASTSLPSIFAGCPQGHMFEPGSFGLMARCGTFVYKGALFAAVGLAAGLVGTAISNGLISMRKKMDPGFETPNKPPPTLLNAVTWATHMGLSSNLRYQTLNGIEYFLAKATSPMVFKSSVVVLRCLNNVLGGMTFVMLARFTGSQSVEPEKAVETEAETEVVVRMEDEKEKLVNQST